MMIWSVLKREKFVNVMTSPPPPPSDLVLKNKNNPNFEKTFPPHLKKLKQAGAELCQAKHSLS